MLPIFGDEIEFWIATTTYNTSSGLYCHHPAMYPWALYLLYLFVWAYDVYLKQNNAIPEKTFTGTFDLEDHRLPRPSTCRE